MERPDFLIVGAMKAGTTSLLAWLGAQPEVFVPAAKEPNFFSDDRVWGRGLAWYRGLFEGARPEQITGEASVACTDPANSTKAAARAAQTVPGVKVIFVIRDPIGRLRSHYRHEVLRGRERRPLGEALEALPCAYVERSRYFACFEPFTETFAREQLAVTRFEGLYGQTEQGWRDLLGFLGLEDRPRPAIRLNASDGRQQFSSAMRIAWDAGIRQPPRFVPPFVRRAVKPIFLRRRPDPLLATADDPVPAEVDSVLDEDAERMREWLGEAGTRRTEGAAS